MSDTQKSSRGPASKITVMPSSTRPLTQPILAQALIFVPMSVADSTT
ncbi:MAG: hypothetical protein IPI87_03995 [Betaproteobacteria bacterium]|nr:hypothetical protein [Betaproteobacteria bacterium]